MIHPTAVVHPQAELSSDAEIGPYSIIGEKVRIGKDTKIDDHVVIRGPSEIGENCRIFPFASIGTIPQDMKFEGEDTRLIIGNNNTIRESVTINRGTLGGGGVTRIGNDNFFMAYSHVAHDCQIGNHVIMANAATLAGHIEIEDFAVIGGLVAIHQFVRIGCYAFIGGASAVNLDVPPFCLAVGNRAKLYGLNTVGLKRQNFSSAVLNNLKKAYWTLFRSKLPFEEATKKAEEELVDCKEAKHFVEFIKNSERGVTK